MKVEYGSGSETPLEPATDAIYISSISSPTSYTIQLPSQ